MIAEVVWHGVLLPRAEYNDSFEAAADALDLWLSTASGRASGYLAVHRYWRADPTAYFAAVEEVMLAHGGRPQWGKMHTLDASALRSRYPRFDDFVALRDRLDPRRAFRNPYLDRVLGGERLGSAPTARGCPGARG